MNYKSKKYKEILLNLIARQKENLSGFVQNPEKDFSRTRKLPYEKVILSLLTMEGASLPNELLRQFGCDNKIASTSAFVQQRSKILPAAFENLFHQFSAETNETRTFRGFKLLAVDGSDIQIPTDLNDTDSLIQTSENRKSYNLIHLNALYDINSHTYTDAIVYKNRVAGENQAFVEMVDRSPISENVIVVADRGYESYNNMAHVQEKGWKFLIRIKDFGVNKTGIIHGYDLPSQDEFDVDIDLKLTRKQTKDIKELLKDKNHYRLIPAGKKFDYLPANAGKSDETVMYRLQFRIVRFKITESTYEVVITNLGKEDFSPDDLKQLYAMRWGIETSFRELKYTIGLLHFHSKKVEFILQEIFAQLIMYNFSELITSHVVIKKKNRKYEYKVNFSVATHICREFLFSKNIPPNIEDLIARYITPIRPGRSRPRDNRRKQKQAISFMYRIA